MRRGRARGGASLRPERSGPARQVAALAVLVALAGTPAAASCGRSAAGTPEAATRAGAPPAVDGHAGESATPAFGGGEATGPAVMDAGGGNDSPPAEARDVVDDGGAAENVESSEADGAAGAFATPVALDGDVTLEARRLGRGRTQHAFEVAGTCPLGRVELDVGVDSMPDGFVELRAPSGRSARLPLHVLQIDFVRTWDWADLGALHDERRTSIAGTWTFESRLAGADYAQPATGETAPMPTPEITLVRLRLYCEPSVLPPAAGEETDRESTWTASWEPRARAPRPGADARTLLAVHRDCAVAEVAVTAELAYDDGIYAQLRLVTPAGIAHVLRRVEAYSAGGSGTYRLVQRVELPEQPRASGIWELSLVRSGDEIRRASLDFTCAAP